jgi:hypothetical protein
MHKDREILLVDTLKRISKIIDDLKYECKSSIYILDDDEMTWIFYCRYLADETLRIIQGND